MPRQQEGSYRHYNAEFWPTGDQRLQQLLIDRLNKDLIFRRFYNGPCGMCHECSFSTKEHRRDMFGTFTYSRCYKPNQNWFCSSGFVKLKRRDLE